MLGLLGMESTSFLEELSRTDEVAAVPSRTGGNALANGTMMPQDVASSSVEMQQRMPQQASWGVNQLPLGGAMHYQNSEYGLYNAAKQQQQQRMGHVSGYGSGMMPAGNSGSLQNHPTAAPYGYSGMSGMHNVAMTPPRQAMSVSGAVWNHSPGSGGVSSDPMASSSYGSVSGPHGSMAPQHQGSIPQQMQMSANRSNGMQGQMYGQYHDYAASGAIQQTRMMGYSDSQNQMQEMAYGTPMGSPPPASSRLMQMSGQAGQMSSQVHYQQQQQRYPSMSANMDSSRYMADSQSHHAGGGHMMTQYQYNQAMMQGQPRMLGEGGYGHFYAQPLYRMSSYGATTQAQAQMMSPNAMAQMSPQARSGGAARLPDMRSPQSTQVPVCSMSRVAAIGSGGQSGSASFRQNLPGHTTTYTVAANSTAQVGPQRITSCDSTKAGYSSGMPVAGTPSAQQPMPSSMMGSSARYAVPGYQMNTCQNVPGTEMRHQLYSGQQQPMMDMPDRSHYFSQSHSQSHYQSAAPQAPPQQQQHSPYAGTGVMIGSLSPGQMAVHKQSQIPQQQQQQQLLSPGQASASSVSLVCHHIFCL